MTDIDVRCALAVDGWTCVVALADADGSRTEHHVTVAPTELARLAPTAADPTALVRTTFEFLLEREPKTSILGRFALPVVSRYFPEYEREIRRRLSA